MRSQEVAVYILKMGKKKQKDRFEGDKSCEEMQNWVKRNMTADICEIKKVVIRAFLERA